MNAKTPFPIYALLAAVLATASLPVQAQQAGRLPAVSITAGMHVIKAEVAASEGERQRGLMFREQMGQNEGMMFIFDSPAGICMWMKNTQIPLSVAFIDDAGRIVNIEDMQPHTTDSHCAKKQVRYALEMNLGWFKRKNIKPGNVIEGIPR